MINSIKGKLLIILLSFTCTTILTSIIAFKYFIKNRDSFTEFIRNTENINVLMLQDMNTMHEFFENETLNPAFFYTGKSKLLVSHRRICNQIETSLLTLELKQKQNEFSLSDTLNKLQKDFSDYRKSTDNIIHQILMRGFKDYGAEGRMRQYAHHLEIYNKEIGMINVLQLRRHEKDFIIRQEDEYVQKHLLLISEIQNSITVNQNISSIKKDEILKLLTNYSNEFKGLVFYERKIGMRKYGGLKEEIDNYSIKIFSSLASLVQISKDKVGGAIFKMEVFYMAIGLIFIIISVISAVIISKKSSYAISDLKNKIAQFVESDFTHRTVLPIINSENEIDTLITNVSIMEQHIVNQMEMLKQSNKDLEMLFYATSRDIKLPLIAAKELVDEALTKITDVTTVAYLEKMKESWQNLYNIIDELGIITNIRNVAIKMEPIAFQPLIKNVYSEFKSLEWYDSIIFSLDIKLNNEFYSSQGLIRAIFRNLIENSIKYATKRQGQNFLKISIIDQNAEMIRIEISDNGIGIKKDYQEKIFDMFFRGTSYTSGTGLGLYIVKSSLEKLNGVITVESAEDKGTTFTLLVPNNSNDKKLKEKIIQKIEMFS